MRKLTSKSDMEAVAILSVVVVAATIPLAWATRVIWIIRKLASDAGITAGQAVLGLLGAFVPPVGVVHGYMIWLGVGF